MFKRERKIFSLLLVVMVLLALPITTLANNTGVGTGGEEGGGTSTGTEKVSITNQNTGVKISLMKIPKGAYYEGEVINYIPYSTGFSNTAPNVKQVGTSTENSYIGDYPIYLVDTSTNILQEELYWTDELNINSNIHSSNISKYIVDPSKSAATYGLSNTDEINYADYYNKFNQAFTINWYKKVDNNHISDSLGINLKASLDELDDNDEDKIKAQETLTTIIQLMGNVYEQADGSIPTDIANALDSNKSQEYDYCLLIEPIFGLGQKGQIRYMTVRNFEQNILRHTINPSNITTNSFDNSLQMRALMSYTNSGSEFGYGWILNEVLGKLEKNMFEDNVYSSIPFIAEKIYYNGPTERSNQGNITYATKNDYKYGFGVFPPVRPNTTANQIDEISIFNIDLSTNTIADTRVELNNNKEADKIAGVGNGRIPTNDKEGSSHRQSAADYYSGLEIEIEDMSNYNLGDTATVEEDVTLYLINKTLEKTVFDKIGNTNLEKALADFKNITGPDSITEFKNKYNELIYNLLAVYTDNHSWQDNAIPSRLEANGKQGVNVTIGNEPYNNYRYYTEDTGVYTYATKKINEATLDMYNREDLILAYKFAYKIGLQDDATVIKEGISQVIENLAKEMTVSSDSTGIRINNKLITKVEYDPNLVYGIDMGNGKYGTMEFDELALQNLITDEMLNNPSLYEGTAQYNLSKGEYATFNLSDANLQGNLTAKYDEIVVSHDAVGAILNETLQAYNSILNGDVYQNTAIGITRADTLVQNLDVEIEESEAKTTGTHNGSGEEVDIPLWHYEKLGDVSAYDSLFLDESKTTLHINTFANYIPVDILLFRNGNAELVRADAFNLAFNGKQEIVTSISEEDLGEFTIENIAVKPPNYPIDEFIEDYTYAIEEGLDTIVDDIPIYKEKESITISPDAEDIEDDGRIVIALDVREPYGDINLIEVYEHHTLDGNVTHLTTDIRANIGGELPVELELKNIDEDTLVYDWIVVDKGLGTLFTNTAGMTEEEMISLDSEWVVDNSTTWSELEKAFTQVSVGSGEATLQINTKPTTVMVKYVYLENEEGDIEVNTEIKAQEISKKYKLSDILENGTDDLKQQYASVNAYKRFYEFSGTGCEPNKEHSHSRCKERDDDGDCVERETYYHTHEIYSYWDYNTEHAYNIVYKQNGSQNHVALANSYYPDDGGVWGVFNHFQQQKAGEIGKNTSSKRVYYDETDKSEDIYDSKGNYDWTKTWTEYDYFMNDMDFIVYKEWQLPTLADYSYKLSGTKNSLGGGYSAHDVNLGQLGVEMQNTPKPIQKQADYKTAFFLNSGLASHGQYGADLKVSSINNYEDCSAFTKREWDSDFTSNSGLYDNGVEVFSHFGDQNKGSIAGQLTNPSTTLINGKTIANLKEGNSTAKEGVDPINFYPYVEMHYDSHVHEAQPVNVLARHSSTIVPTDYIVFGWTNNFPNKSIRVKSNMWSSYTRATNGSDVWRQKDKVLPGGAIFEIDTPSPTTIGIKTYQTFVTDEVRNALNGDAAYGSLINNYKVQDKIDHHDEIVLNIQKQLETHAMEMYVSQDYTKLASDSDLNIVRSGTTIKANGEKASTDTKYWLHDDTPYGTSTKNTENDIDVNLGSTVTNRTYYVMKANVKGVVTLTKSNSPNGGGTVLVSWNYDQKMEDVALPEEAQVLDTHTKLITNFFNSLDRTITTNESTWYKEAFRGIGVVMSETTFDTGLINPSDRMAAIDPKLTPIHTNKGEIFTNAHAFAFKMRRHDILTDFGTLSSKATGLRMINETEMFKSENYYIPNATVHDIQNY